MICDLSTQQTGSLGILFFFSLKSWFPLPFPTPWERANQICACMDCGSTEGSGCVYVEVPLSHNEKFNQPHYSLMGYKYNLLTYKGNISYNSQEIIYWPNRVFLSLFFY